jgi:putative flippase GtrA
VTDALIRKTAPAFAIYIVIGGIAAVVNVAVFWLMLHDVWGNVIGDEVAAFVISTFVNYLLCVRTIFASKTGNVLTDIAAVYAASLLALGFNLVTLWVLTGPLRADPMIGNIAGIGAAFVVNFAARQFIIFAPHRLAFLKRGGAHRDPAE